ncbi:TatA/E family twin arginine-targeting protein translocase [Cyanobium sp. CH-040]|uniref:TatA/E family twin arginine-targeting protein translocase n=1 Tax=Cyanobium sp. CH-040 TaxID=2823708 RepID=UPI0020CF6FB4|nr:TatA/E family twin arginine-targeting protein translocase [Cyanobium sp. CH-040]MCP9927366.1 TatA/E family twin arginine-targeting protein translocase [Cyanobium sp. CH-040]
MNFFGIGLPEMAVIAAIALLVFGPKRLPELGRSLGRTLKGFQSASSEFEKEFRTALSTVDAAAERGGNAELPLPSAESPAAEAPAAAAPVAEPATPAAADTAGESTSS